MEGKGVFTWSDGLCYTGEYYVTKNKDIGVFTWPGMFYVR